MNIYAHYKRSKAGWGIGFGPRPTHCAECMRELPAPEGCGTGYGSEGGEPVASHPDAPALKPGESLERCKAVCYSCCGERDKRDMESSGRAVLYLTHEDSEPRGFYVMRGRTSIAWFKTRDEAEKEASRSGGHVEPDALRVWFASNWPGSLRIKIGGAVRRSRNNFGAQRVDAWFTFGGFEWHGVNLGARNDILRCKRTKRRA